ncbi:MAG: inosine-uridine preferring nucleoside hydrolase [Thermogutta sp.]|nr:MAG: inosine-uridine preferring nucleoside hydrolase [Thermogutta sp.]
MLRMWKRRDFISGMLLGGVAGSLAWNGLARAEDKPRFGAEAAFSAIRSGRKIPVILDTDIGDDIDDTWALTLLLKCPELDVRLVVGDNRNAIYRGKLIAKLLEVAGRTDIPVGLGVGLEERPSRQSRWVADYDLKKYPGTVYEDGVAAIIETIKKSDFPVTLICIGPVQNIAEALKRDPGISQNARFVGMHGSVYKGYGGSPQISAEYNVRVDPKALQAVFAADWEVTITPLDTCGLVHLTGEKFRRVYECPDKSVQALMENYQIWREAGAKKQLPPPDRSSTLYDTVAVYLAVEESLVEMETLSLVVTDDGFTRIDASGRPVRAAVRWKNMELYEDWLVQRLVGK